MSCNRRWVLIVIFVSAFVGRTSSAGAQDYKEAIGYNALVAEKGAALENGAGVTVMQAEALAGPLSEDGSRNYLPRLADSQFRGKSIWDGTGTTDTGDFSSHATSVGRYFYGNTTSMTPGITRIASYRAGDYFTRIFNSSSLNSVGGDPLPQGFDVGNHSYIAGGGSLLADKMRRFDFVINRDNTVMVVGTNNGSRNLLPQMMASSYNAITVGKSYGGHASGTTPQGYGPGRIKPDIVAPAQYTSHSTPIVASAAALLRQAGAGTDAIQNEVIKSTLFAGAIKDEFANWSRTTARPIDDVYGYGELNIYNSYHIFEGGEFDGSTSNPATNVGLMGWDYGNFSGSGEVLYDFEILAGQTELSAALVWNIDVIDNDPDVDVFDASTTLANLDLELFDSSGSFLGLLVDSSLSTEFNTEHIYLTDLNAGNYTFRISGDSAIDYGFSWRINSTISAIPEPNLMGFLASGLIGLLIKRRRV